MITDHIIDNDIAIEEMMWLAMQGGAFELLAEEPELYSPEEGKPAKWPTKVSSMKLLNKHAMSTSHTPNSAGHTKSRRNIF
jgi:hypothetical protein